MAQLEMEPDEIEMSSLLESKGVNSNENNGDHRRVNQRKTSSKNGSLSSSAGSALQKITSPDGGSSSMTSMKYFSMALLAFSVYIWIVRTGGALRKQTANASGQPGQQNTHSSSFGGLNNIAHPAGAKAAAKGEGIAFESDSIFVPVSNLGHAVKSLNVENIMNLYGHYVHDEHRSPYASHLYDKSKEFLDQQQEKFIEKMKKVRQTWGAWDFVDDFAEERPWADFTNDDYKDKANEDFIPGSWQTDEEYVSKFITEAKSLVDRVTEAIYAEYGSPLYNDKHEKILTDDQLKEREEKWKIHILPSRNSSYDFSSAKPQHLPIKGIAVLTDVAFAGLVRKLLHALITNDEFYAVLGGHSAAAGHGNNFQQNRILMFHRIMEPVFDKLGIRLISRNMAMGGVGTLQISLGGADLYGEADIMEWDSGMTENSPPPIDFFNKQAILTGERVPLLLHANPGRQFNVLEETNHTAWAGHYLEDVSMLPETVDLAQAQTLPWATRFLNGFESRDDKYNAICWEPRSDVIPLINQDPHPGSQVGWHPGNRVHQWQGRKLALVVLKGLAAALEQWEKGIETDGFPLAEKYWHIGPSYQTIRENLRTHINTPKGDGEEDVRSPCEKLIPWMPRICRVAMHGYGMWQPRAHQDYDLLNILHAAPNGYKPTYPDKQLYTSFDLLPLNQAVPDNEIDVHAIAIATTAPAPDLDHSWTDDVEIDNNATQTNSSTSPPSRRWLTAASHKAFRASTKNTAASLAAATNPMAFRTGVHRQLAASGNDDDIVPGRGWETTGWRVTSGLCDGSAMSTCGRIKDEDKCLMTGANDNHLDVHGTPLSGWLVFTVPNVKEGIILARMEWWCGSANKITESWTEVNDGKTADTTPYNASAVDGRHRELGKPTPDQLVPQDFEMDIAINGKITKVMKREEWLTHIAEFTKNCAVWPLFNDEEMAKRDWKDGEDGEDIQVAIRFRSSTPKKAGYCVSHVYYA